MYKRPFGEDFWECEEDCDNFPESHECLINQETLDLKNDIRLLWEQHVYWTRMTIISMAHDLPDLEPTTQRLLRNAKDWEMELTPLYGNQAANEFGSLITEHLIIAADLVKAAKEGNNKAAAKAERKWYRNADEIICFLVYINPCLSERRLKGMWYSHLSLTKSEAVARLSKDYAKDIAIFDQIEKEALMMADDFADGIIRQFSEEFLPLED